MSSLVVALTGGIASGKSAASAQLAALGAPVFDADQVARELVEPGTDALEEIAAVFGRQMLRPDGTLDRRAMRERVFGDSHERRKLEAILHPRIHARLLQYALQCRAPYCVLAIPLLAEVFTDYRFVDRVLVLDVSPAVQTARVMGRDGITAQAAQQIVAAQAPRKRRLEIADDLIDNDGAIGALRPALERLHCIYGRLARDERRSLGNEAASAL